VRKNVPTAREVGEPAEPHASSETPPAEPSTTPQQGPLAIVGIGASAGGLEALEQFVKRVPEKSGMAFVIVQHLDPTHKGMLVELLQRATKIKLVQVDDRRKVEPNHIYVIPPNKDLSLLHGALHLLPPASPRGLNLPIDFFFRSLAEDRQERSIGVILSGMGTDGTLGLRAIKEKAGASFVQSLTSAKFDGMPRSAIEAGVADVIAPVEELPERIIAYLRHAPSIGKPIGTIEEKVHGALEKVFVLLRAHTGNDFSVYKRTTILRRIERRMGLHQIDAIGNYVRFLRENPREIDLLFNELLIGVTSFFRDPLSWDHLKNDVLPPLLAHRPSGGLLRAWVPGCSTGEEAYSLAMVFKEALEPFKPLKNIALQIFATDLDREAIEKARVGAYPDNIAADVPPERLHRFFVQDEHGYRIGKEIREMVVFAPQNIIMDPPFTKLDILSCRNLLIYLSGELQKKIIPLFHYSLNPGGILFLGSAETVGSFTSLFAPLDAKSRIYRRLDQAVATYPVEFPTLPASTAEVAEEAEQELAAGRRRGGAANLQALADRVLVQRFSPLGILCNDKGDILYFSARAGKYLEPPAGKANLNIFAMAREGLRYELSTAFATSLREDRVVKTNRLRVRINGGTETVVVTVQKLSEPHELRGTVIVVIEEEPEGKPAPTPAGKAKGPKAQRAGAPDKPPHLVEMEYEIQRAHEEAQTVREEMQTSQEELRSANEELQSTNEELQSTNEALTTSKEEMQSLNEELQTVNHELQSKVDLLSRSNNDMKNLLNSTEVATLFLDGALNVRRFTTPTSKIIKLIPGDAGRPITDIATDLDYPDLAADAREVLQTLVFKEKRVSTKDGRFFTIRIMPYRTLENVIDGVVMTFADASASRALEVALLDQASELKQMADSLPSLVWGARPDGMCDYVSRQWPRFTGAPDTDQLGFGWIEQLHPEDREAVREEWRRAVRTGTPFEVECRMRNAGGEYRWFKGRSIPIRNSQGEILKWYGTFSDVNEAKRGLRTRTGDLNRLSSVLEDSSEAFLALSRDLVITAVNHAAEKILGRSREETVGRNLRDVPALGQTALETKLRGALKEMEPVTFELELGPSEGAPRRYEARVHPHDGSPELSVFLRELGGRG
jgi:PAS domain S-box-containing protein